MLRSAAFASSVVASIPTDFPFASNALAARPALVRVESPAGNRIIYDSFLVFRVSWLV
jgi:hypothetical protein